MSADGNTASSQDAQVVKSAVRTLEILEYFDEVRQPLNVVGVAAALGYPQSSAAALLRSLTAMGYLHFNRKKRTYMPTDRVPFLGSWINPPLFEDGALPRLMRAIGRRTGQLVVLAARNKDLAQYIHVLNEPSAVAHHIKIGQKRPLATSGVGQILLSAMDEKAVRRLYHRMNAYTASTSEKTDIPELLAQLSKVRQRGYTFSRNRVVEGYGVIAFPVPTARSNPHLALGVGGLCETLQTRETEIVDAVREELKAHLKLTSLGFGDTPRLSGHRPPAFTSNEPANVAAQRVA
ncbi:IclR family transcriptional regulator [Bradyrhizobium sp. 195]|uniref:IclR family transcriptional regulator n=1 Tax=Bradyrhizobium sp. 195 TaxID=2782662 RepID=UPI0020006C1C|nr:IclR family transcriptional regulator C-terminal domain-containing protein [Bradyrhizobium sp. 195]UPK29944.1 helix-turn-helix domain-containing protein [Bradyrhizobium sp. 195]